MSRYGQFLVECTSRRLREPGWRAGQTAFNVLAELEPELAEQVRAGELDPFHHDARLQPFMAWVRAQLDVDEPPAPPPGPAAEEWTVDDLVADLGRLPRRRVESGRRQRWGWWAVAAAAVAVAAKYLLTRPRDAVT